MKSRLLFMGLALALVTSLSAVTPAAAVDTTSTSGVRIVTVPVGDGTSGRAMEGDAIALQGISKSGGLWPGSGALLRISDDLPSGSNITILDMNKNLEIVGRYLLNDAEKAFVWSQATGAIELPAPPGLIPDSRPFEARGISDNGWIVGVYRAEADTCGSTEEGSCAFLATPDGSGGYEMATLEDPSNNPWPFFGVWDIELATVNGVTQHIAVGDFQAWSETTGWFVLDTADTDPITTVTGFDVNRNGEIVGTTFGRDVIEAAYWAAPDAPKTNLGRLSGDDRSDAYEINDAGVIVGSSETTSVETTAVVWESPTSSPTDLGHIADGVTRSIAFGLNEDGTIVGESDRDAVIWDLTGDYEVGSVIGIEPIPDQTLDFSAGEFADFIVVSSGAQSATFELSTDTDSAWLDPNTGDPDTARFFFIPSESDIGINSFTVSVSDSTNPSIPPANETFTIEVIDGPSGPITILVDESIIVIDDPSVLPPTVIEIFESIAVTDDPVVRPPVTISITEDILVSDEPTLLPSVLIELTEQIDVDDAVIVAPETLGTIRGLKWEDTDGDAIRDSGEPVVAGVTIYLDLDDDGALGSGEPSTTTAADGTYEFNGLVPGLWIVREIVPTGYDQTFPIADDNKEHRVDLSPGETATDADFGNQAINLPPVIQPIDDVVVDVGNSIEIPVTVTDPEGDPFTKSVEGLPRGLVNGIIPFTPLPEESGQTFLVTVTAVQNDNPDNFDTETFTVTVTNRPPEIEPIDDVVGLVGSEIVVEPVITDPEGDDVTITWEGSPPNGLLNGIFILTPTEEQTDSVFEITVTATETGTPSNSASETFNVFVAGVPDGPTDPLDVDPVGVPGGDIEIEGGGFLPGSDVNVYFLSDPVLLGTTPVGPDGTFQTSFPLPEDASDGPHQIIVVGLDPSGEVRTLASDIEAIRDSDDDGLRDTEETLTGTNPENADTDGDGLIDGLDASWLVGYLNELPRDDFKRRWHRPVMKLTIGAAAFAVNLGEGETALDILDRLDRRADGCGTQPDRSDWIVDCDSQIEFRTLLGLYKRGIETLTLPDPIPWL